MFNMQMSPVHYSEGFSSFSLQVPEDRRPALFIGTVPNPPLLELATSIDPPRLEDSFELLKHLCAQSIESHSLPPGPEGLRLPGVLALGGFHLQAAAATRTDRVIAALRVQSLPPAPRIAPAEAFGPHRSALSGAMPAPIDVATAAARLLRSFTTKDSSSDSDFMMMMARMAAPPPWAPSSASSDTASILRPLPRGAPAAGARASSLTTVLPAAPGGGSGAAAAEAVLTATYATAAVAEEWAFVDECISSPPMCRIFARAGTDLIRRGRPTRSGEGSGPG